MFRDKHSVLLAVAKKILETPEAEKARGDFELSRLQVEGIISEIAFTSCINTLSQYWKQLIWEKCIVSCCTKQNILLQKKSTFAVFEKKRLIEIIKESEQ